MPTIQNTFEGMTVGAIPTNANTGGTSGTATTDVLIGTGNEVQAFSPALHGTRCVQFSYGTTAAAYMRWPMAETGRFVWAAYVYYETLPTVFDDCIHVRHSSGYNGQLAIGADGKTILMNAAGAGLSVSRAPNVIPTGRWLLMQMARTPGTTTTDGKLEYAYFEVGATTPIYEYAATGINAGTTANTLVGVGRTTGRTETRNVLYDTVRAQTLTTGWIPQYVNPNELPLVTLTETEQGIEPGRLQELTATATDPDGTITNLVVTQTSGTPTVTLTGTGGQRQYTAPPTTSGTTLTFQATATDNTGAAATSTPVQHTILPAVDYLNTGGTLRPGYRRLSA